MLLSHDSMARGEGAFQGGEAATRYLKGSPVSLGKQPCIDQPRLWLSTMGVKKWSLRVLNVFNPTKSSFSEYN